VQAAETVDVSFEVAGELARLPLREGSTVAAGGLVAALEPTDFELAVREAEVQLRLAALDLERKEMLLREQGIPRSVVEDARTQHELWQVRLAQARERQADARIVAPFDALVARRYVDNHTRVQVGEPIVRLLDMSVLEIVASVPSSLLATVTPEQVVSMTARFDFLPDRAFPLTYQESSGEANPVAQTYEVTFAMAPPVGVNVLSGMTARVRIELTRQDAPAAMTVPTTALQSDAQGQFYVWIFDPASGAVTRRAVSVGRPGGDGVMVERGLEEGELVVAAGASQLQDGMRVRPLGEVVGKE
jgi:RND family efflux transporter MFP subunit